MSKLYVDNIASKTGGTDAIAIDSNGILTRPNQPIFQANNEGNASSVTPVGSASVISSYGTWTAPVNRGNIFNISTGKFTCATSGVYLINFGLTASALQNDAGDGWGVVLFKNGTQYTNVELAYAPGPTSGEESHSNAAVYADLVVNDYIEIGWGGTNDTWNILHWYLSGHLVG